MKTASLKLCLILLNFMWAFTLVGQSNEDPVEQVFLKKGTMVTLRITEGFSSSEVEKGHLVRMEVVANVVIDRKAVILSGAFAEGQIIEVSRSGIFGKGAKLQLSATSLQSIDGQRLPIKTRKHLELKGRSRKGVALGLGVILPATGMIFNAPITIPFVLIGFLVKGEEVEIDAGQEIAARTTQDVIIQYVN